MFSANDIDLPLQLHQIYNNNVQCYRALPANELKPYIYYYWWLDVAHGDTTLEVIPDNAIDLVMSPQIADLSLLYLPASCTFSIPLSGPITYVGISFRAESAASFFSVSQTTIQSCLPGENATTTLHTQSLLDGIQGLSIPDQLAATMDSLATTKLSNQHDSAITTHKLDIDKALAAMHESVGTSGMKSIAERFELSDRQFRRIMASLFGYGPKKVQRVMRLQSCLREILVADTILFEDGYYDEAHKIKEIRALTGLTPGQIKRMSEIYNLLSS